MAGLRSQVNAGVQDRSADGMRAEEQLLAIGQVVQGMVAEHSSCLMDEVLPALRAVGIELLTDLAALSDIERQMLDNYYRENVFPVLTPLAVDPGHPFPYISNLSLSLAVVLQEEHGERRFARVTVPKILPRWVPLGESGRYVPLETLIAGNLEALFPGVRIVASYLFRISRNIDLELDHEEADDLLLHIQEEVRNRRFAEVVRVEVEAGTPDDLRQLLLSEFNDDQQAPAMPLAQGDIQEVRGLLDAADLLPLSQLERPELLDPPFYTSSSPELTGEVNLLKILRDRDVFLHHPYHSFTLTVEQLIATAVDDPDVVAIKLTLYRTGGDSSIARLLQVAAERGKQVAVLIELQARFDEENNIRWGQRLEDAGAHVSYGVWGLKTHAKILLIIRREAGGMRRYAHVGTGNYNPRTARAYTDFGLLTTDPDITADLAELFNSLTGYGTPAEYRRLIVAPIGMRQSFLLRIDREREAARAGRPARIIAKMNALVDPAIIRALYAASQDGVTVDLIIRGICCLRPGIPGVSDHIRVVSVIGRFLEHSRAFAFYHGGEWEVMIGSADWMPRNLDRRIETVVPLQTRSHRHAVLDVLELMLRDNRQAWELQSDGSYIQRQPGDAPEVATQTVLLGGAGRRADG